MTSIEWTDVTWNPTDGCSVCSPGCANCYAMRFAGRFSKPGERYHGLVSIGKNKRAIWTGELRLDSGKLAKPLSWKKPKRIFVNSMSDLFHENLTNEQIAAVFGVMAACPQHTFQILTKRATRMREWFEWLEESAEGHAVEWSGRECGITIDDARRDCLLEQLDETACDALSGRYECCHLGLTTNEARDWPLQNVWLGVSIENQDAADERIPDLLATPAAVRFLSCEPLIGPVDLNHVQHDRMFEVDALHGTHGVNRLPAPWPRWHGGPHAGTCERISWVIAGCESGPGARSCATSWLVSLRDQCADAGVPFFLKQAHPSAWGNGDRPPTVIPDPLNAISGGPGSTYKAGGVIGLPYLFGKQHAEMPR